MQKNKNKESTSWEEVSSWYNKAVGDSGHYYHQNIILPKIVETLGLKEDSTSSFLDLACGQGILSRYLTETFEYVGADISPSLIPSAKEENTYPRNKFLISDITKPLPLEKKDFDFCTIILALQNLESPLGAFKNIAKHLAKDGKILLVMNHPCFRIPKESSWGIDEKENIQYRRMDAYYSSMKIPIQSNPSLGKDSANTFSFHHPISSWTLWLKEAGFVIEWMEEWCSDKVSTGKYAQREDLSREEFPLFLAIRACRR